MAKPYYHQGGITIYHGDCREILPALTFSVIVSDPPYGLDTSYGRKSLQIAGDGDNTLSEWLIDGWPGMFPMAVFADFMTKPGGQPRRQLAWDKGHFGLSGSDLPWLVSHEVVWIYGSGWIGKKRGSVLRTPRVRAPVHPTEKPVDLLRSIVVCAPSGVICDPFMGSGTTLVAAKLERRQAIGIEIEEKYCEIAASRLDQQTLDFGSEESVEADHQLSLLEG